MSVLEVSSVRKEYRTGFMGRGRLAAVDGVDIRVEQGQIYGFLGPNGAGKTTTLKIILNFIRPTSGKVAIFGEDTRNWKIRERIGFLPDNPNFYPFMTGRSALYVIGRLFSLPHGEILRRIDSLAEELGMERELSLPIQKHSRGMRQRIGLAQALINDPELIIMDEPMSGLDPIGRKMFREVILRRRELGKTVFFSSHILSDIESVCTRIGILNRGRMIFEDDMKNIPVGPDGKGLEALFMEKAGTRK